MILPYYYLVRSNIKVEFFKDKVKITSPGGLYKSSIEDMLKGVQAYRNLKLVHIFDKMKYIENFGTGIPRKLEAYENSGESPINSSMLPKILINQG